MVWGIALADLCEGVGPSDGEARPPPLGGNIMRPSFSFDPGHLGYLQQFLAGLETMASLAVGDLFGVKGRVALVTGGCSGIGLMIAKVN